MRKRVLRGFNINFQEEQTIEIPADANIIDIYWKDKGMRLVAEITVGVCYVKRKIRMFRLEDELDIPGDKWQYAGCVFVSDLHGHQHVYVEKA